MGREDELASLLGSWEDVKAGAGPRAVAIVAEPGLGKTRLVQELYAALVEREQGGAGYWPRLLVRERDDLKVNPDLADCDLNAALPFLWWALRLSSPGERNRATAGALMGHVTDHLAPHLEPFHREQRRRDRFVRLAKLGAGTAADAALDLVPVLGIIKKVAEVGSELKGIHDEWRRDAQPKDLLGAAAAKRESLADEVVADLARLFAAPGGHSVPAVILLDDAQFSASDPGVCSLTEVLAKTARSGGWPLLLVVTHWEREWEDGSSPIASAVKHAQQHGLPLSTLRLAPLPDLSDLLRATLPGLFPDQESAILTRAGGNPLLLDEMLRSALTTRARAWFAGRDVAGPLTDAGLRELLTKSGRLIDLVADRLADTPDDVQFALGLAALQGDEFEDWLVSETALAVGSDLDRPAAAIVAEAAVPHALVARLGTTRAAFSQRVYRDVARDALAGWVDEEEARAAYMASLKAVAHGQRPFPEDAGPIPFYAALVDAFEHDLDDPGAPRLAAHGLTKLIDNANRVGDVQTAAGLASRMPRQLERLEDEHLDGDLWWLRAPAKALVAMDALDSAEPLLERLLRLAREGYEDDANEWSIALYGQALLDSAEHLARRRDEDEARQAVALALQVVGEAALSSKDGFLIETATRAELAGAQQAGRAADVTGARAHLDRSLALVETLAVLNPGPWRDAQKAAVAVRVARFDIAARDAIRAEARLAEATKTLSALLSGGGVAGVEEVLLEGLELLAQARDVLHDTAGAMKALEESLGLARRRLAAAPGATAPAAEVADTLVSLARHHHATSDLTAAWEAATEAHEVLRRVLAASALRDDDRVGTILTLLAELAYARGDHALAHQYGVEALSLLRPHTTAPDAQLGAHWRLLRALVAAVPPTAVFEGTATATALVAEARAHLARVQEAIEVPEVEAELADLERFLAVRTDGSA